MIAITWSRTGSSRLLASSAARPTYSSQVMSQVMSQVKRRVPAGRNPERGGHDAARSINRASLLRQVERERRDVDVERLASLGHHAVGAHHEAGRCRERHAAWILVTRTGPGGRL